MNGLYLLLIFFITLTTIIQYLIDYFHILNNQNAEPIYNYLLECIISGILFFFLITKLTFTLKFPKYREKENVLKEQGAHHLTKREFSPGKLFLTSTRLIFKSQFDIPKHNITITLESSNSYSVYKMFGFVTMGLKVKKENTTEIFILNRPKKWIQALQSQVF